MLALIQILLQTLEEWLQMVKWDMITESNKVDKDILTKQLQT